MAKLSARQKIDRNLAAQDDGFRWYFSLLPELLDKISSSEPALAYCFQRLEAGQRIGLYALLMREYRTDMDLTWDCVDRVDITRRTFPDLFKAILGKSLDARARTIIEPAEQVRDAIMHGRQESQATIQSAILNCLEYGGFLNQQFESKAGFKPFGQLRGVTSKKGKPQLDKKISRAVLLGLQFPT